VRRTPSHAPEADPPGTGTGARTTQVPQLPTSTARHHAPHARSHMHINVRGSALARHTQKESVRSDQTRPHNEYGTFPTLSGQGRFGVEDCIHCSAFEYPSGGSGPARLCHCMYRLRVPCARAPRRVSQMWCVLACCGHEGVQASRHAGRAHGGVQLHLQGSSILPSALRCCESESSVSTISCAGGRSSLHRCQHCSMRPASTW